MSRLGGDLVGVWIDELERSESIAAGVFRVVEHDADDTVVDFVLVIADVPQLAADVYLLREAADSAEWTISIGPRYGEAMMSEAEARSLSDDMVGVVEMARILRERTQAHLSAERAP